MTIIGSGVWVLLYEACDMCLGIKSVGLWYGLVGVGFLNILMFLCCFSCGCCKKKDGINIFAAAVWTGFGLFIIIIHISVYSIIYSTIAFGSLEKQIASLESWMDIKHCLYQQTKLCSDFQSNYANANNIQFFAAGRHFPPIQSGCCKPPKECNMNFSSPAVWKETGNGTYSNTDCYKWDDDPKKLCYNCEACKHNLAQCVKKT